MKGDTEVWRDPSNFPCFHCIETAESNANLLTFLVLNLLWHEILYIVRSRLSISFPLPFYHSSFLVFLTYLADWVSIVAQGILVVSRGIIYCGAWTL